PQRFEDVALIIGKKNPSHDLTLNRESNSLSTTQLRSLSLRRTLYLAGDCATDGQPTGRSDNVRRPRLSTLPELIESQVNHRCGVKREDLRNNQATNDGNAERFAEFAADAHPDGERQRAEHRGHRRHHDRPEPNETRLVDRFFGTESFVALS